MIRDLLSECIKAKLKELRAVPPLPLLTSWSVFNTPVITRGAPGEMDSHQAVDPHVVEIDGDYYCYYGMSDSRNLRIGLAKSKNLVEWTKHGIALDTTKTGIEKVGVVTPYVIEVGEEYWMYYHSYDGERDRGCLATSLDGISWTKYSGNPVVDVLAGSFYSRRIDPEVVFYEPDEEPPFKMIFGAYEDTEFRCGYAESQDGKTWSIDPHPVFTKGAAEEWDGVHAYPGHGIRMGDTYYLFYQGYDGNSWRIGLAYCKDLRTWTRYANNPIVGLGNWNTVSAENPCLVKVGNNFVGLFCGAFSGSGIYPSSYDIGLFYQAVHPSP